MLALLVGCYGPPEDEALPSVEPTRVYLWFADGGRPPVQGSPCEGYTPPPYGCRFGHSPEDCRQQVLGLLERWYADFNVVFTLDSPTGAHQSVVITDRGDWCGQAEDIGGLAPALCDPLEGATVYAFQCGRDPRECASIITQEHAHTIGLAHTDSPNDVMFPVVGTASDGFEARENGVSDTHCRTTQDSHALMERRLGLWGDGEKPSALR